ncbi:hypothetical protein Trydic_g138 [Trypoxylus dichotomus]
MEAFEPMKDSKYRIYISAVDKALKNFEYTSEWADLIAALGKLNKVLLSNTKYPDIPRRIKIGKRLAQCMHPALPSGVHLKALETYDTIFKSMGTDRLSLELFIYSAGLFPLLGHAAMNIRPILLMLYETHFVPLRERLRPALSGFLSGVLPGLETGSDYFDRTNVLLENVCEGVGPTYFYTCIWQCIRSNSPVRLPAISYVLSHYSRKVNMEDQLYLMGNDVDIMVSGLCAAIYDPSILVQRSALDLLIVCFPMNNTQLLYSDMVRLVTAALTTILRRDMSLNRRLYSWLLNSDVNPHVILTEADEEKVSESVSLTIAYGLILEALRIILKEKSSETSLNVIPCKLLTSLFEKPQIGPVILDHILYDTFRSLYLTCLNQQKQKVSNVRCVSFNGDLTSLKNNEDCVLSKQFITKNCQELVKNANLLFATLQPYYIWAYIEKCFEKSLATLKKSVRNKMCVNEVGSGEPLLIEICILTGFLLDIIPIETYDENTHEILPNLFKKIMIVLEKYINILNEREITTSLELCTKILMKIQPISTKSASNAGENEKKPANDKTATVEQTVTDANATNLSNSLNDSSIPTVETGGLEKSKSDSKINENIHKNELFVEDTARERSNSNQMLKKKDRTSPKIDKKVKGKKSKSNLKLPELRKEELEEIIIETHHVEKMLTVANAAPSDNEIHRKTDNKHIIICLKVYKRFLVTFLQNKILVNEDVDQFFETLVCDKESRIKHLETVLNKCLRSDETLNPRDSYYKDTAIDLILEAFPMATEYDKAVTIACNLLLEFAAFQHMIDDSELSSVVPYWLKVLIACACCTNVCKDIQLISMNALIEIFSLAKSQKYCKNLGDVNTNIIITGILDNKHVDYIEENTRILKVMCEILWKLLGTLNNQTQTMLCVTLLYQLHNIFPKQSFCEDVIGHYLIDDHLNTEYFKRFTLLIHLGRDLNIKLPAYQNTVRNFDKCLLKIFDNLQNVDNSNIKLLSESFLTHSLLRSDIPRLLHPIFMKLLTPSTARVSITNISIQDSEIHVDPNTQDSRKLDDTNAKKIFAISNINGNVLYHVTNRPSPKPQKKKWYLFSRGNKKMAQVVNTTTTFTSNSNVITKKSKDYKNFDGFPNVERSNKNNVKLFINPLSSKEIYPNGIDGSYTKIDVNTSQKSSSESLSSNNDVTQSSNDSLSAKQYEHQSQDLLDRSFNYETSSMVGDRHSFISESRKSILEHIEPISDGLKDNKQENCKLAKSQSFDEKSNEKLIGVENLSLVHSWSYSISDSENLHTELELSTSAEDFFNGADATVRDILDEILDKICTTTPTSDHERMFKSLDSDGKSNFSKAACLYPMHQHMCLYGEVFDTNHVLYALKTLKNCLTANPQLFIKCSATAGLKDLKNNEILYLLARHRKSILGFGFGGDLTQEHVNFYRGYMFLDVIILICLNYARSYFFHDDPNLIEEEISNNLQIQLKSLEILDIIVKNLINIVNENTKGFAVYIADMLMKCNLQKIVLHCLLTSVRNFDNEMTFAEEVLLYNNFKLYDNHKKVSEHVEGFQVQLLR